MALRHKDVISGRIRENEYEHPKQHILDSQATGDMVYAPGASDALTRKAIGATGQVLRVTGGLPVWESVGIADDNLVEIDHASVADNDYAKFTANGLEGRSYTEVLADLSGQAGGAFSWNSQNLTSLGTLNTHTLPGGTDTICLIAAIQELTNKTLNASVLKGTFTNDGIVVLPPFTLGGTLTINGQVFDAGSGDARINTTGSAKGLKIISTQDGVLGIAIVAEHISASPAVADSLLRVSGIGRSSTGATVVYGYYDIRILDPTNGAEIVEWLWRGKDGGGGDTTSMRLTGAGVLSLTSSLEIGGALTGLTTLSAFTLNGTVTGNNQTLNSLGDTFISDGYGMVIGHTAQIAMAAGDTPEFQVIGIRHHDAGIGIACFSDGSLVIERTPRLQFLKSAHATVGSNTIVRTGEILGAISFLGADGGDFRTEGARIQAIVNGTPDLNDLPTELEFFTAKGVSADDVALVMTLTKNGDLMFGTSNDSAAVADQVTFGGYELSAGNRCLAFSSEVTVVTETVAANRTLQVRINGVTYKWNLIAV